MKFIVLDTETSDLDPTQGAQLLQLAWMEIEKGTEGWQPGFKTNFYIQYSGLISPKAQAVHHIPVEMLTEKNGAVPRQKAIEFLQSHIQPDTLLAAHNIEFDSKFLPELTRPWVCTMRAARHIWPESPAHSNQVLRYWLALDIFATDPLAKLKHPHEASYDVATTASILLRMLEKYTPEQLLTLTHRPVKLRTIGFGKHKGQDFNMIPPDYLRWLRQNTKDEDVKHTIDTMLR